ncbi:MAG TPA: hypothetical protein VMV94_00035 [Phycisphaerae bacterium]|nr:hypothetical protein [Phycisphaerae bacterium]
MVRHSGVTGGLCALLISTNALLATVIDSGYVENTGNQPGVVFSTTISAPSAAWIQLNFEQVLLSGDEGSGTGSYFVMTSTLDSAVQTMHASHLVQWLNRSAYFNGDEVSFELIAYPGTGRNRVVIGEPTINEEETRSSDPCPDHRLLSQDPRIGRVCSNSLYAYCTAFIINDPAHSMLTAGHCAGGGLQIIEFNVPLSHPDGSIAHPSPSDQYAVDPFFSSVAHWKLCFRLGILRMLREPQHGAHPVSGTRRVLRDGDHAAEP